MGPSASKRVEVIRDLIRGLHQGQQQLLHKQAEHMAASDTSSEYRFILATEGPKGEALLGMALHRRFRAKGSWPGR